ncbi:MAG TPA: hypothetical protein VEW74_05470 [Candidatus Nitrosotalea sp.]|nr:hypothetical protein [Candidatus Nitrosotalea sp.]
MIRTIKLLAAMAFAAGTALPVSAQQMPPPEGPAVQGNPYGAPAATQAPDKAMLAQAKKVFAELQAGKIDPSQFSSNSPNASMNAATVANAQRMIGGLGKPVSFLEQQSQAQGNNNAVLYLVTFQNGQQIDFLFMVDSQGKVAGLGLGTPH